MIQCDHKYYCKYLNNGYMNVIILFSLFWLEHFQTFWQLSNYFAFCVQRMNSCLLPKQHASCRLHLFTTASSACLIRSLPEGTVLDLYIDKDLIWSLHFDHGKCAFLAHTGQATVGGRQNRDKNRDRNRDKKQNADEPCIKAMFYIYLDHLTLDISAVLGDFS